MYWNYANKMNDENMKLDKNGFNKNHNVVNS